VGAYQADLRGARALLPLLLHTVRSAEVRALGHVTLAHLEMIEGRPDAAMEALDAASALDPEAALEHRGLLLAHPFFPARPAAMARARADLEAWRPERTAARPTASVWLAPHEGLHVAIRLYILGLLEAREGDHAGARRRAGALEAVEAPPETRGIVEDMARSVLASSLRAAGDDAGALAHLEGMRMRISFYLTLWSPFFSQALERFLLAESLRAAGREEEAIRWYRSFAEHSISDMVHLGPAHLRLGEIHERLGETVAAADHFDQVARLWGSCSPALRGLAREAGERAARLRDGSG
jgi:tetratricopeptide (TPR) repeat protein